MSIPASPLSGLLTTWEAVPDPANVERVEFYIDGVLAFTERFAPYKPEPGLDTRLLTDGAHTFAVTSFYADAPGETAMATREVANGTTPPPPDPTDPCADVKAERDAAQARVLELEAAIAAATRRPRQRVTVGDHIRRNATAAGLDIDHLDDTELGSRLASMPLEMTDDHEQTALWLVFGTRDGIRDGTPAWSTGVSRSRR